MTSSSFDPIDPTELPLATWVREWTEQAVTPVADLDELLDLVGRLLHKVEDADDFERALDGIARLCDERPADFAARTAPFIQVAMSGSASCRM